MSEVHKRLTYRPDADSKCFRLVFGATLTEDFMVSSALPGKCHDSSFK